VIGLSMPEGNIRESLRSCANSIENADLAKRLIAAEGHFEAAEKQYKDAAGISELFTLPSAEEVAGIVTLEEMKWLYKNKFAKLGSPCRWLYDRLRIKAKICPLCNCRPVGTLDHYLAQSSHPAFVLTPVNLVPACADCNKAKLASLASTKREQTLHPYFDTLPADTPWLKVEVTEEQPPGILYKAAPPGHWDGDLSARIVQHFEDFSLAALYAAQASSELAEMARTFSTTFAMYGAEGLRDYLSQQARDRRGGNPHSWKAALYEGLSFSDWFVNIGYKFVA